MTNHWGCVRLYYNLKFKSKLFLAIKKSLLFQSISGKNLIFAASVRNNESSIQLFDIETENYVVFVLA
jgi:hypothetical protein